MVGIIRITTALIFDECEPADRVSRYVLLMQRNTEISGTHSLLAALRGAGMSQRTRRPYLRYR